MKSVFKIAAVILVSCIAVSASAQKAPKSFEGTVKYGVEVQGENIDAATRAQMPTEIGVYYKESKSRTEMITPMYSVISLSNTADGSMTQMFDMMGMKFYVVQTAEDLAKLKGEDYVKPEVKLMDESKVIAGYNCKKAEITKDGETMEVFYTNEISVPADNNSQYQVEGIEGILMEYVMEQQGMTMTFRVKEVKKGKLSGSLFSVPSDFEKKTMDELNTMFGG